MSPGWGSEVVHGFCYSYLEAVVLCRAESAGDFGRLRAVAMAGRMHAWRIVVHIDTGSLPEAGSGRIAVAQRKKLGILTFFLFFVRICGAMGDYHIG